MCYMQQICYHADYGHFRLLDLSGWEEYVQKVRILSENKLIQIIENRYTN
jgi:hypothetical protein